MTTYEEWEASVSEKIKADSLWKMAAYQLGLFLGDLCWCDTAKLLQDRRMVGLSDQLYRASGSVSPDEP
jgi:hypothetical protein